MGQGEECYFYLFSPEVRSQLRVGGENGEENDGRGTLIAAFNWHLSTVWNVIFINYRMQ